MGPFSPQNARALPVVCQRPAASPHLAPRRRLGCKSAGPLGKRGYGVLVLAAAMPSRRGGECGGRAGLFQSTSASVESESRGVGRAGEVCRAANTGLQSF